MTDLVQGQEASECGLLAPLLSNPTKTVSSNATRYRAIRTAMLRSLDNISSPAITAPRPDCPISLHLRLTNAREHSPRPGVPASSSAVSCVEIPTANVLSGIVIPANRELFIASRDALQF